MIMLLVRQLALVSTQLGIVASPEGVCFTRLGLQFALQLFGGSLQVLSIPLLASLVLL